MGSRVAELLSDILVDSLFVAFGFAGCTTGIAAGLRSFAGSALWGLILVLFVVRHDRFPPMIADQFRVGLWPLTCSHFALWPRSLALPVLMRALARSRAMSDQPGSDVCCHF